MIKEKRGSYALFKASPMPINTICLSVHFQQSHWTFSREPCVIIFIVVNNSALFNILSHILSHPLHSQWPYDVVHNNKA